MNYGDEDLRFQLIFQANAATDDDIALFLQSDNDRQLHVYFRMYVVGTREHPKLREIHSTSIFEAKICMGVKNFLSKRELREKSADFMSEGYLHVRCVIEVEKLEMADDVTQTSALFDSSKVSGKEEVSADFQLGCDGHIFSCHKDVLASRSGLNP